MPQGAAGSSRSVLTASALKITGALRTEEEGWLDESACAVEWGKVVVMVFGREVPLGDEEVAGAEEVVAAEGASL